MNNVNYLECSALYILAQFLTILWVEIPGYKKMWLKTGERFSLSKFINADWNVHLGILIFGAVCLMLAKLIPTIFNLKINYDMLPLVFAFLGGFGCTVAARKWGATQNFLEKVIDKKITDKTPITDMPDNKPQ
jgi:hypothetical protein